MKGNFVSLIGMEGRVLCKRIINSHNLIMIQYRKACNQTGKDGLWSDPHCGNPKANLNFTANQLSKSSVTPVISQSVIEFYNLLHYIP